MTAYIVRRLLILPVILFGLSILIFALLMLLDPIERASLYVSQTLPKGKIEDLVKRHGLDDPIPVQYARWMGKVLRGDLGWSKTAQRPVLDAILYFLPATVELALGSIVPIVLIGVWLGVLSAVHHNRWIDHITRVFSIVGWSFPTYVFGLIMLMIFYAKLQWFPAGRLSDWALRVVLSPEFTQYTHLNTVDALLNGRLDVFWDAVRHLVMPVITLSYLSWALLLRVTRSSMLEALRQDYIMTARAKGLKEWVVINRHALPNALIPVATIAGLVIISLLNGVVITETIFNYKGLGWFFANAALNVDVISVLGLTLFNGVLIILGNLAVDISYVFLDPRVRLE